MKKTVILILAAFLFLSGCVGAAKTAPQAALDAVNGIVSEYNDNLAEIYGDDSGGFNVESPDKDTINVTVTLPEMSEEMTSAMLGDEGSVRDWNYTLEDIILTCDELKSAVDETGNKAIAVSVSLMSEKDQDLLMVEVQNGVLVYDAVSGIDLR